MPITKSAKKALRGSAKKRVFNIRRKRAMKDKVFLVIRDSTDIIQVVINSASKAWPDAQKITIESSCYVTGNSDVGISTWNAVQATIRDCYVWANTANNSPFEINSHWGIGIEYGSDMITIDGCTFYNGQDAIKIAGSSEHYVTDINIQNCVIDNYTADGIWIGNANDVTCQNNIMHNVGDNGFYVTANTARVIIDGGLIDNSKGNSIDWRSDEGIIKNIKIYSSGKNALYLHANAVEVTGCSITEPADNGIELFTGQTDIIIQSCSFNGVANRAIKCVENSRVDILGCTFSDGATDDRTISFYDTTLSSVKSCTFNVSSKGSSIGVYIRDGDDNDVIENKYQNYATGIHIEDGDDCSLLNNRFYSCTTPIDANRTNAIRPMIMGNNWEGCTNDASTRKATNPRITANIDKNGAWWTTGDTPP